MPNKLFQNVISQMKPVLNKTIGVTNSDFLVVACSDLEQIGIPKIENTEKVSNKDTFVINNYTYKYFGDELTSEYIVFVEGTGEESKKNAEILAVTLGNIKHYYDDKYDRSNFIKNIIMENILSGDIYFKARELHFDSEVSRVCMLIKIINKTDVCTFDVIQNLFPDKEKDFVININENTIVLVKEVPEDIAMKDLENLASSIADTLSSEFYTHCIIGIGTRISEIKDLSKSYKEAQVAIEVSKVFDTERTIVNYDNLGIARLVYQLPTTLCEMFLKEVFRKGSIDALDQETLFTIRKFFENNLNVSETSRKLFVHRNTLVYRLEKIKKTTGLDLRDFEDAIVFKVALMVKKYLSAQPVKY